MIAPTPPAANLHSQLMRVCVREPSSLSNRPEMFDRKMRFLTVRLRNLSGVKITSSLMTRPRPLAQHARRRKQALFDDGIDRGWGAPARLAPQLAHAFEAAHEIVHGDTRGMNAGEIAMNEIGEQST